MRFSDMTAPELQQVSRDSTLVLVPIAACEQHSRHLPTFTDTLLVTAIAEGVESYFPDRVLLLPSLWLGASSHHLRLGGTLSADAETLIAMLCDVLSSLLEDGYRRVLLLNGHGGNIDAMHVALRRMQPRYQRHLLAAASYWDLAQQELAALAEGKQKTMGHACEFETSMMMALKPQLVRWTEILDDPPREEPVLRGLFTAEDFRQRTRHGGVGYPQLATAEKGQAFLEAAIERSRQVVQALLERPLTP
jgi:creatinine amidohydrolase